MILETPAQMAQKAAKRFRNTRKAKKVTIKALSEKSGVPYSTIRRFESEGEISFVAFVKLVSALNLDAEISGLLKDPIPDSIEEVIRGNNRKN